MISPRKYLNFGNTKKHKERAAAQREQRKAEVLPPPETPEAKEKK